MLTSKWSLKVRHKKNKSIEILREAAAIPPIKLYRQRNQKRKEAFLLKNKYQFAQEIIREAGHFIKSKMDHYIHVEEKTQFDDLVTNLDKETQELLISKIKNCYPEDNVFAEEDDIRHPINQGNVWVLDPIDGTVNFIVQGDHFAIMIAYFEAGVGKFGLIYDVMRNLLYCGGGEFPVCVNGRPLPEYEEKPFNRSLLGTNACMYADNYHGIRDLAKQTLGVRVYGGAGISMAQVMAGQLLGYFSHIQPWDYAAAYIMGKKLGYTLLTLDGHPVDFNSRQTIMFIPQAKLTEIKKYIK